MRIGTLGAARITPAALLEPAAAIPGVDVVAVAARDRDRAASFAAAHGIPTVHESYTALLADETIDAIYNPLPNSEHAPWSIAALEAGKHVLCEKPLALNAAEARTVVAAAEQSGRILMEGYHWRYHPVAARVLELAGELGELRRAEATFFDQNLDESDIRYQLALGGGSLMDLGCYCVHALRTVLGSEPLAVTAARAVEGPPGVDVSMTAELTFPGGVEARMRCGFDGPPEPVWAIVLEGSKGRLRMENYVLPQFGNRLTAELASGDSIDEELPLRPTYAYQLEAFARALVSGEAPLTSGADVIANAVAIDAIYSAAGLPLR